MSNHVANWTISVRQVVRPLEELLSMLGPDAAEAELLLS